MEVIENSLDAVYSVETPKKFIYTAIYKQYGTEMVMHCYTNIYSKQSLLSQLSQLHDIGTVNVYKIPNPFYVEEE